MRLPHQLCKVLATCDPFLRGSSGCDILCVEPDLIAYFVCRGMLMMGIIETHYIVSYSL